MPANTIRFSRAWRKALGASLAAPLLLSGTPGAHASLLGTSGYVFAAHVGNRCAAVFITPQFNSPNGGQWFAIDISSSTPLTPQAVSAQVGILLGAANAENLAVLVGLTPIKLGVDYDPTQTVTCSIDAEGDGQLESFAAKNFNYPPGLNQ